ncbi:MAG: hypothetical protein CMN28_10740 [Salinisphaeraceae bacterium]|jgi:hypothetical protein|nr:hypothetical protein [Salinisphaeraceae bacterium]
MKTASTMTPTPAWAAGLATALLLLGGCQMQDQNAADAPLDLQFSSVHNTEGGDDTGIRIALLEPDIAHSGELPPKERADGDSFQLTMDRYREEAQAQIFEETDPNAPDFQSIYVKHYENQVSHSINQALESIFSSRGFSTERADRMATVRDQSPPPFLASVPATTIVFIATIESEECDDGICTQKGDLTLEGQYLWQLVEPTTGHPVTMQRLNLWSLSVHEPYVVQTRENPPGMVDRVRQMVGMDAALENTADDALTRALDRFYSAAMEQTDAILSRGRIIELKQNIEELEKQARPASEAPAPLS